ncbi:MAG TPA: type IV secretion system DNA-binding domain-containing protein [Acidiferrobacter sp.]|nr:type IV secretion system DNA-binding domain-containing protein [Acidiferrobacter sp.]
MSAAKSPPPAKARSRADRRRLRALIDAGEQLEAHGLLAGSERFAQRLARWKASAEPVVPPDRAQPDRAKADRAKADRAKAAKARILTRPQAGPSRYRRLASVLLWLGLPFAAAGSLLRRARPAKARTTPLTVHLGMATTLLHQRGRYRHPGRRAVVLGAPDLGQNLLVLGGIGSGKTTSVIQPVLLQCLKQGVGGLIFDIKGDFGVAAAALSRSAQRSLTVIGPNRRAFNLLRGLTPEAAAGFLKSALLLTGSPSDPFWVDTAVELCRNALGVLSFIPEHYSLAGLYEYLFCDDVRARWDRQLSVEAVGLSPQALRLLRSYQSYHEGVFTRFDAKVVAGVLASAAQVLTPFTHPDLVDAFCPPVDALSIDGLGAGEIFLVDLPLAVWGVGAKVIYTFLKLRFFQYMQRRPAPERSRPVLFLCDEYQEIVSANKDGLSDLNFWDKGRAFGTVGIISAQSIASFYAALGDRDLADTLLQNFRQKLCLRTEDLHTIHYFERLLGRVACPDRRDIPLTSALLIRRLYNRQALAVVSVAGEAMEDVIDLPAVFVD